MGMTIEEYESSDLMAENEFLRKQLAEVLKHRRMFETDYENRLKADLKAMLIDLQLDVEGQKFDVHTDKDVWNDAIGVCSNLIKQKINELKAGSEDEE